MSDLTDAIDDVVLLRCEDHPALLPVLAAARSVADAPEWLQRLLEDPPPEPDDIWWCQKHDLPGTDMECDENGMGQRACQMVRRPLLEPDDAAST